MGVWPWGNFWNVQILWRNKFMVILTGLDYWDWLWKFNFFSCPKKVEISALLYCSQNLCLVEYRKFVENLPRGVHVNFLKAERSLHRWALEDLQRIHAAEDLAAEEGGGVEMHVLEDAGHWVCCCHTFALISQVLLRHIWCSLGYICYYL